MRLKRRGIILYQTVIVLMLVLATVATTQQLVVTERQLLQKRAAYYEHERFIYENLLQNGRLADRHIWTSKHADTERVSVHVRLKQQETVHVLYKSELMLASPYKTD